MLKVSQNPTRKTFIAPRLLRQWAGYGAGVWSFIFAALSIYWAAGGTGFGDTIGKELENLALSRDPGFVAILWITGLAKILIGILALALVQAWGRRIPRWILLTGGWATGLLLTLYSLANFVEHGLMQLGFMAVPKGLGEIALRWHLLLWDPWWLIGGALFTVATWQYSYRLSKPKTNLL